MCFFLFCSALAFSGHRHAAHQMPSAFVWDLGVYVNSTGTTKTRVSRTLSASVGRCLSRFYGRWSFHWYWHALTTAMLCSPDYRALSSTGYSWWWMLVHDLYVWHGSSSTSRCCYATSTVYDCLHESSESSSLSSAVVCGTSPQCLAVLRGKH